MPAVITEQIVHGLEIVKEVEIAAPIDVVFGDHSRRDGTAE